MLRTSPISAKSKETGDGIPQAPLVCRSRMSQKFKDVTDIDDWNRTCTSGVSQLERGIQEYMADDQRLLEATLSLFQRNAKKTPSVGAAAESLFSLSSTKVPTRNDSDVANDESPHSVVSTEASTRNDSDVATTESPLSVAYTKAPTKRNGDLATVASPLSKASTKVPTSNDGGDAVMNEEMKPSPLLASLRPPREHAPGVQSFPTRKKSPREDRLEVTNVPLEVRSVSS